MRFLEIINRKKFALLSVFLFIYVMLNLLDGERGLISYYKKQILIKDLLVEKKSLKYWLNGLVIFFGILLIRYFFLNATVKIEEVEIAKEDITFKVPGKLN